MLQQFTNSDTALYKSSKIFGDYYESEAKSYIPELFNPVLFDKGKYMKFICLNDSDDVGTLKGWDLKFGIYNFEGQLLQTKTFEIKTDKSKTANVFFERSCRGVPSGVFVSQADYFFYWLPLFNYDNVFICKPNDLINLIKEEKYHIKKNVGEGGRITGHLRDKESFIEEFKEYGGKVYSYDSYVPDYFQLEKDHSVIHYEFEERNGTLSYKEIKGRAFR